MEQAREQEFNPTPILVITPLEWNEEEGYHQRVSAVDSPDADLSCVLMRHWPNVRWVCVSSDHPAYLELVQGHTPESARPSDALIGEARSYIGWRLSHLRALPTKQYGDDLTEEDEAAIQRAVEEHQPRTATPSEEGATSGD